MIKNRICDIELKGNATERDTTVAKTRIALWAVWLVCAVVKETNIAISSNALTGCCYTALFLLILIELTAGYKYNKRELVTLLVVIPLLWMHGLYLGNTGFAQLFTLIFVFRKIDMAEISRISLYVLGLTIAAVAALSLIGAIPDTYIQQAGGYYARQARGSFGFAWPSRIQTYVLVMFCLYAAYRRERMSIAGIVMFCIASFLIECTTDSRLPMYLTFLLACLCLLLKCAPIFSLRRRKNVALIYSMSFLLAAAVSILLPVLYSLDPVGYADLNHLLTGRLNLSATAMDARDLTLFGTALSANQGSVENYTALYGYFDCGYLNFLYSYGVVPSVFFIVVLTVGAWRIANNNEKYFGLGLLMMAVVSMFYSHAFMNPSYGMLLFLAGAVFCSMRRNPASSQNRTCALKREFGAING